MTCKVLTLTAALGLAAASQAAAQSNGWLGSAAAYSADDYRTSYSDARRAAYDNGYRDGVKRGEQAARDRRPYDIERERDYRGADNGYNRSYGDRTRYRNDYRGGFAQGYRDGYNRNGYDRRGEVYRDNRGGVLGGVLGGVFGDNRRNGGNGRYADAGYGAFQNGASDGYKKGLEDLQDRRYPDVRRHKWYRNGDHDYDKVYGSKDAYKVEYRRGFEEGYDRAFRQQGRRY